MNVLFVVWENDPFFKLGGLGDVARSLPGALKTMDVDIRVVIPYYKVVKFGRKTFQKTGNSDRLSQRNQIILHETKRRWKNRQGHGRFGAAHRGAHRRKRTRRPVRNPARADRRAGPRRKRLLVVS